MTALFSIDLSRIDVMLMSVLPALVNFAIFIYALYVLHQNITNNVFAIFVFLVGCWQLGDAMIRLSTNGETALEWSRLSTAFILFVIPFGVLFTLSITGKLRGNSSRLLFTALFLPPILLLVPVIGRLDAYTVTGSGLWYWVINPEPVPATTLIYGWISLGSMFNLVLLWYSYIKAAPGDRKEMQLMLLAVGYTIPCIGGIIMEVLFPLFFGLNDVPVTTSLITSFSLASIIAIKKFWLFEYSPKNKWEQILESMNEGILIVDNDDRIMYANKMFCEVVGYSFDEIRGKVANEMFLDEAGKQVIKKVIEDRKGKKSEKYEIALKSKNGGKTWVNMSGSPYTDFNGDVIGSIGIQTNINKEKQVQALFRALVENVEDIVSLTDKEGKIVYVSPAIEKITGFRWDEIKGREATVMMHPDFVNESKQILNTLLAQPGVSIPGINRFLHKQGHYVWVEGTVTNLLHDPHVGAIVSNYRDITSRKETEEKIRQSEENLHAIFENTSEGFILADLEGTIRYFNSKARETVFHNISSGVEVGASIYNFIEDDAADDYRQLIARVIAGETIQYDRSYVRDHNKITWFDFTFNPVYDHGRINGFCITGRDITDRKASEEMQALIMSSSLDAIICMDTAGRITFWNPQAERVFGLSASRVLGKKMKDTIIPERFREMHEQGIRRYLATGQNHILNRVMEITALSRDGTEFPIEMSIIHLEQPGNEFFCAFIKDISDRKESEVKLRNSEERLKQAQAIAHVGNWEVNFETNTAIWSDEAYRIYGLTPGMPIKAMDSWLSYVHHEDLEFVNDAILRSQETQSNFSFYHRIVRADEVLRYVFTEGRYEVKNTGGLKGIYGVVHDVTDEKLAEEKLVELNEKLAKRAKELAISNEELEQFAYIASHDLQEPLRMVTSFLTQLENKYKDQLDDRAKEYIFYAADGAVRMRQIILDLLEYSRVGRKEVAEPVDMNLLLRQIVLLNRMGMEEKGASVEWVDLPVIMAGKTLKQVVQNLIANALKYQKENVKPVIRVSAVEKALYWQFAFSDNGIGIEERFFDKIFIVFQRLHNREKYSGTGIGLAICKKIVENHGGRIWVESKPGEGSTFYFTIAKNAFANH